MEGAIGSEEAVGDNGMEMWMKPGVVTEGVDHHDHARDTVIEAKHGTKKQLEALLGAMAQLRQQLAVVFEIDAQHDRDGEDKLPVGHAIEDVVGNVLPKLNRFPRMAARAKPPSFARKRQKEFMFALGIGAAHPGKPLVQVSTSQVFRIGPNVVVYDS